MIVLDTSAVMAFLLDEPGAVVVEHGLPESVMCAVNFSELVQKLDYYKTQTDTIVDRLMGLGLTVQSLVPMMPTVARLYPDTKAKGSSLGDRACLALGQCLEVPVLTADRAWSELDLQMEIRQIR